MADPKSPLPDPFARQRAFPDAAAVFGSAMVPLQEALTDGLVVLDTNVLLIPYGTGKASVTEIRTIYNRLAVEDRLRVPGQVAREFAANRAEKLKTLYQQLSLKRNLNITRSEYPLLEGIAEYDAVRSSEVEIASLLDKYRNLQRKLLEVVSGWNWDDPVSLVYREVFSVGVVFDPTVDEGKVLDELRYRFQNQVPPGYKDANNEHSGVGDYLIWKAILDLGMKEKRHLVFVSGDEKGDWWYKSDNQSLYPRFELVDEYRRASNGKSLFIIGFAELLQHFGAPPTVVAEVREEELASAVQQIEPDVVVPRHDVALHAIRRWLRVTYRPARVIPAEEKLIDFWVQPAEGPRFAVDMRVYVEGANIESIADAVRRAHRRSVRPVLIVAVIHSKQMLDQVKASLSSILPSIGISGFVVGAMDAEGRFHEFARLTKDTDRPAAGSF